MRLTFRVTTSGDRWAVAATSATEKRHQLYGAISVIMVMLSEIEGKWRGKEAAK